MIFPAAKPDSSSHPARDFLPAGRRRRDRAALKS
jgi:hypothetical protein